jgi:hypothetical protein
MLDNALDSTTTRWTDENIIDLIRKVRNDLVKDFLDERVLNEYLAATYRAKPLNKVQQELVRQELKDLLISPVDVSHYKTLIEHIKEHDSASLTEKYEPLFYRNIESAMKKHMF